MPKKKSMIVPQTSNRGKKMKIDYDTKSTETSDNKNISNKNNTTAESVPTSNIENEKLQEKQNSSPKTVTQKIKQEPNTTNSQAVTTSCAGKASFDMEQTYPDSFKNRYTKPTPVLSSTEVEVKHNASVSMSSLSSPQSVVQSTNVIAKVNSVVTDASESWALQQPTMHFNHEQTLSALDTYVKKTMFHKISFISSPSVMAFKTEESVCKVICDYFNVPTNERERFWMIYAKFVERKLNQKRSNVSNGMKKSFLGMYKCSYLSFFN